MANQIDAIKNIDKELLKIIETLKIMNQEILKASSSVSNLSTSFGSASTPKQLGDGLKKTTDATTLLNELIKQRAANERKLISVTAKKILIQDETVKKITKENEELKALRQEQRNQVKAMSNLLSSYDKLAAKNNILIKRYQDLAVKKKQGNALTEKEERRLTKLGAAINKNTKILKDTDAEVGRFQRNVGNYASTWDGLGNSINQLTREAPAFANSMQTGFLAISNNLPTLFDEISKLVAKNKELASSGEPTKSVFSQITKSIFSFQTALSLGVTLLTIYGKDLVEFISNLIKGGEATRDFTEQQKILNDVYKEAAKSASSEVAQLQLLMAHAADKTKSDESRKKAVDKLIESSGGLIKEQDRLNILNGEAVEIENELIKSILNRAIIQQLEVKISEDINELLDNQLEIRKNQASAQKELEKLTGKSIKTEEEYIEAQKEASRLNKEKSERIGRASASVRNANRTLSSYNHKLKENTEKEEENAVIQKNINALIKEALKLTDDYTLELDENTKSIEKRNKVLGLNLETVEELRKRTNKAADSFKNLFKEDLKFEDPEIDSESIKQKLKEINDAVAEEALKTFDTELLDEAINDLAGTIENFTGIKGATLLNFFDEISKKGIGSFESIADIAKSSFDVIGEVSNAFFNSNIAKYDQAIEDNEEYYDKLLENETLTDEERDRLEQDREAKEEEIQEKKKKEQRKQAVLDRALAVASIISNTAKGVVAALPNIPLSILVGSIGAAQLAVAAATPIPQFAEGGEMTHDGLMMINDHKSGRLEIVERDGKLLMTNQKNAIVEGKRGDIIHKDAKSYFDNLSDDEIINNAQLHSMIATIQSQNYQIHKLETKKVIDYNKINTDRIVKAINSKKTKFNLNQKIDLGRDSNFLNRLNSF